jgi:hypothetical protein
MCDRAQPVLLNGTSGAQPMPTNDRWNEVYRTKAADSVTVEATA